jgi:hypothetical protein
MNLRKKPVCCYCHLSSKVSGVSYEDGGPEMNMA